MNFSSGNISEDNSLTINSSGLSINSTSTSLNSVNINSSGGIKISSNKTISIQGKEDDELVFNNSALSVDLRVKTKDKDNSLLVDGLTGKIGINSNNPKVSLYLNTVDAIKIPNGTTLERPSNLEKGYIRYNSTLDQFEGYGAGNSWGSLGGVIDVIKTHILKQNHLQEMIMMNYGFIHQDQKKWDLLVTVILELELITKSFFTLE